MWTKAISSCSQENLPIAFYSRIKFSTTSIYHNKNKLLSIVELLKEYKNVLLGYEISIHTDHKKLVHETLLMSSDCVMQWRQLIEEYGPEIFYIPGPNNVVTDSISRLPKMDEMTIKNSFPNDVLKRYACTKDINDECPLDAGVIAVAQRNESPVRTSDLKHKFHEDTT